MQFESSRLLFNKFTSSHLLHYKKLVSQFEVMKHISGAALNEDEAHARFVFSMQAGGERDDLGYLAVSEKATNDFVGLCKIVPFENGMTEVGYALNPEFWRKGYASEITSRLVGYAQELGDIRELIAVVEPDNFPSVRVLTKQNFVLYREIINARELPRAEYLLRL